MQRLAISDTNSNNALKVIRLTVMMLSAMTVLGVCTGCVAEKESLHDHEHEEPPHWPSSLGEAAEFIETRVNLLSDDSGGDAEELQRANEELIDLVAWAPEIAADTDLSEEKWLPIYDLCEAIRGHMESGEVAVSEFSEDFDKLGTMLESAHQLVQKMETDAVEALGVTQIGTTQTSGSNELPRRADLHQEDFDHADSGKDHVDADRLDNDHRDAGRSKENDSAESDAAPGK